MNPTHVLRTLLAERLGQTAGRWPRQLFGEADAPTLREALAARVEPRIIAANQRGDGLPMRNAPGLGQDALRAELRLHGIDATPDMASLPRVRISTRDLPYVRPLGSGEVEDVLRYAGMDGVAPPIIVRQTDNGWQIIDGNRRTMAARRRGGGDVDAIDATQLFVRNAPDGGASGGGNAYREQLRSDGFDVETPLYHGTQFDFEDFSPGRTGRVRPTDWGRGIYLTDNTKLASRYSGNEWAAYQEGSNVRPVFARLRNPYVIDAPTERISPLEAMRIRLMGHDGIIVNHGGNLGREVVVFDPKNVASQFGRAPDAPNAGPRGNNAALASLAALPPGALTLRELLRDRYGAA